LTAGQGGRVGIGKGLQFHLRQRLQRPRSARSLRA
jgi:hypothetical protein